MTRSLLPSTVAAWVAVGVLGGLAARAEAPNADATGTWKWTVARNGQNIEWSLNLQQDGTRLTGTMVSRQGGKTPIENGKVENDVVSFQVVREFHGKRFSQTYQGKLAGDTIRGTVEMNHGGETVNRTWEAKRSEG